MAASTWSASSWSSLTLLRYVGCLLALCVMTSYSRGATKCHFPRDWKGRWYQSGLGEVVIRARSILQKGSCHEHSRDYFLVENRERNCFQCLLIMRRHRNILQYKESFCMAEDTLRSICAQIQVESHLYTLVRTPSPPTRCPFQDAYYFDYNDQVSGFCDTPISYARPCVGHHKYSLHYKHCNQAATYHGQDLQLECVAVWKDGSEQYLYGRFSGAAIATRNQEYRCFKYEYYGSELYLSMSADATCRGLISARDGPLTMKFVKDIYGWPPPSCRFPHWLAGVTWSDVDGRHSYRLDNKEEVLEGFLRRRVGAREHLNSEYRCVELLDRQQDDGTDTYTVLSFSTHSCLSKHQCLKIVKKFDGVIEFHQGVLVDYETSRKCKTSPDYVSVNLLLDQTAPVECPVMGRFSLQAPTTCPQSLVIGCDNVTMAARYSSCEKTVDRLECLHSWQEGGRPFFYARRVGDQRRVVNCFHVRTREGALLLSTHKQCTHGAPPLFDQPVRWLLVSRRSCEGEFTLFSVNGSNIDPNVDDHETEAQADTPRVPHSGRDGFTTKPTLEYKPVNDDTNDDTDHGYEEVQNTDIDSGYDAKNQDKNEADVGPVIREELQVPIGQGEAGGVNPGHIDTGQVAPPRDKDQYHIDRDSDTSSHQGAASENPANPSYNQVRETDRSQSQLGDQARNSPTPSSATRIQSWRCMCWTLLSALAVSLNYTWLLPTR